MSGGMGRVSQSVTRYFQDQIHLRNFIEMLIPTPPTYWICHFNKPDSQVMLCILRTALECELPGSKDCAYFVLASFVPWPHSLSVQNFHAVALFSRWCIFRVKCKCSHKEEQCFPYLVPGPLRNNIQKICPNWNNASILLYSHRH